MENKIYSINGPVVTIKGKTDLAMMEMVYVGKARLVGEVIRMNDKETTIQVYEETGGLKALTFIVGLTLLCIAITTLPVSHTVQTQSPTPMDLRPSRRGQGRIS